MERIKALCAKYNLGHMKEAPQRVTGGLLHTMYHVSTDRGDYAVKQLNPDIMKRPEAMQNMIDSEQMAGMLSNVVPLVSAKLFEGNSVIETDGCYYLVYDWIEGNSVFPPDITEYHCKQIGRLLGRIHAANIFPNGVERKSKIREMYGWDAFAEQAKNQHTDCYAVFNKHLADIKRWDEQVVTHQKEILQNQVISHRDLDPKNVMWNGEQPCLIDWEATGYVNPYQELLEVLHYWIADKEGNYSKEKFCALIQAYTEHYRITNVNWEAVMACSFDGMLGWLEYNVKRVLGLEGSKETDKTEGMQQIESTIKELKKYEMQMQQLGQWISELI